MTSENEPSWSGGVQYATGEDQGQLLGAPERMKWLGQSGEDFRCGCESKEKVKSDAVKNSIA